MPAECKLKQRTWHVGLKRGEQVFSLQISADEEGVALRANVHTELRGRDIDFARQTATRFLQHRYDAVAIMQDLFNSRIEDDINND